MKPAPQPSGVLTGLARVPIWLLHVGETRGLDRRALQKATGLTDEQLTDPDARVNLVSIWELWRILAEELKVPNLGLELGQELELHSLGLVGYSMLYSETLGRALERLQRYSRIVTQTVQLNLKEASGTVELSYAPDAPFDALRHPVDIRLASVLVAMRHLTGSDLTPLAVHFPYPEPDDLSEHRRLFRAPLHFGEKRSRIVLRRTDLDLPVVTADETLDGYLDHYAEELLQKLSRGETMTQDVLRTLWTQLSGGRLDLTTTAEHLSVSPRTLQRRLRDEETSFGVLLDRFRREASSRLLRDRNLAISEIAFMLGYAEPSTFYRAFRRWTGMTPLRFRRGS